MTEKQSAHNGLVGGSSPSGPTTIFSGADSALAVGQSPSVGVDSPNTQRLPQRNEAEETLALILRAFAVFNGFDGPSNDGLWWRVDDKYAPVTLLVNCNDLFFWACADCEHVTADNIEALEAAYQECLALDEGSDAHLLWVCRLRGMRPQGAYYKYINEKLWPLFNACGPEREAQFGNPKNAPALPRR